MYDMVYYWPMFTNVSVKMSEVCVLCVCVVKYITQDVMKILLFCV